ncbi:hypothetical protein K6U16_14985 [Vibrio parahaemolyticus]|uniref:hypothetical protein n=1 Tax=Gammaproteobacteria TaxID=1236 RepID=UPI00084B6E87|nr:hypothetical protein [Vibrio parahaemolyticus]ELH9589342.1 hypothetical protein [Vibrio cholerae]EGQ8456715.1 hypothetical protein [Vibrio parahaemolyticus]EGQ8464320.1 hypothetical protein [Vibrio parahaemolyticus]EGQ9405907.1 hypothetical protein [Vibrio parahaemolyticus]EGR0297518.1 hypothetical protein [Vibrio parahaemolyticus]
MKYLDVAVADAVNERLDRMESIVEVIRLTPDEMSMGTAKGCLAVLSELLSETKKMALDVQNKQDQKRAGEQTLR